MCDNCKNNNQGKRLELKVYATKEAIDSLTLIQTRLNNADQSIRIDSLPENTRPEIATAYFKAAIEAKADAQFLMNDWWKNAMQDEKLKNKGNVYIDFETREFYVLEA